jgi:hypothetical protein
MKLNHISILPVLLAVVFICTGVCGSTVFAVDDAKAEAAGIRKLSGKHLTLYTDMTGNEIDRLPAVFDEAFPQYCRYFHVSEQDLADWHMTGFLMKDKDRFLAAGLLPRKLPPFEHGFSCNDTLWIYDQPSDYYRRHLLLHEGVHGLMNTVLGSCGPPWYMEGIAEFLATHRLDDGKLTLGYLPKNRKETPEWGRIRILQDAVAAKKTLSVSDVIHYPADQRTETDFYAWCWALSTFLDQHPRYQERFRQLIHDVRRTDFTKRFLQSYRPDWPELCEEWQVMTANLEYGYDVARSAIDFSPGKPLSHEGANVTVAADRGWQNTGLRLEAGVTYQLTASGRYQIAQKPTVWWCEPNGVSIRYDHGWPLGILLAAVRANNPSLSEDSPLLHPKAIGLGATLAPTQSGTLFLKINDSAGELSDNAGTLRVNVRQK